MNVFQVLRKSGKYSWHPCILRDAGKLVKGGRTTCRELAVQNMTKLEADFPNEQYAILTITKKEKKK